MAAEPYIRESRRIRAEFTVVEQHVGVEARAGATEAEQFSDSVGIGSYRIDLHPSTTGRGYLDIPCYPFQVPLGALLPVRLDNLIAAGKCLGVTHITNGCYRLHPVEWNVGEAAGALAAYALDRGVPPRAVRARADLLADFQRPLTTLGIELRWISCEASSVRAVFLPRMIAAVLAGLELAQRASVTGFRQLARAPARSRRSARTAIA